MKRSLVLSAVGLLLLATAAFSQDVRYNFDKDADFSKFAMGTRGQRFSMLVNDGVVEQLNVEEPGAFNVSSADYLIERL